MRAEWEAQGLWVKGAVQHSVPVSTVSKSGEGWRSDSEGLTHTGLVQRAVAFPQGEGRQGPPALLTSNNLIIKPRTTFNYI